MDHPTFIHKEVYKRSEIEFPEITVVMPKRAVKCTRCDKGYRHYVGNCVVCDKGPAPMSEGDFYGKMPDSDDHFAITQKFLNLASGLIIEEHPNAFWEMDKKRPYWCYDMYISFNSKL